MDVESLRIFLQSKGILEAENLEGKDQETYYIANMSSYMNEAALDDDAVDKLNEQLAEIDNMQTQEDLVLFEREDKNVSKLQA